MPERYDAPAVADDLPVPDWYVEVSSHYDVRRARDCGPARDCGRAYDSPPVHAWSQEPHYGSAHYPACLTPSHAQVLRSYSPDDKP